MLSGHIIEQHWASNLNIYVKIIRDCEGQIAEDRRAYPQPFLCSANGQKYGRNQGGLESFGSNYALFVREKESQGRL